MLPEKLPPVSTAVLREQIVGLEKAMLAMPEHQVVIETRHHFAPGIYAREIFIPKGVTLTGKIHKTAHVNVVSKGRIRVLTEKGMETIEAPYTFIAQPGTKRIGHALEDTVWTTFHASDETDLKKLEEELISPSFEALESKTPEKLLEGA